MAWLQTALHYYVWHGIALYLVIVYTVFLAGFCLATTAKLHSKIHCSLRKMHLVMFGCQWGKIKCGCFSFLTTVTGDVKLLVALLLPLILCATWQFELVGKSLLPSKAEIICLWGPLKLNGVLLLCFWIRNVSVTLILIYFIWTSCMWTVCCRSSLWAEGDLSLACSYGSSRKCKCWDH